MSIKTETEFRTALGNLGLSDETIESEVVSALAKGTITADQGDLGLEVTTLDRAADEWAEALNKASHAEPDGDEDGEDEDEDGDEPSYGEPDEDDGAEEMSKALGEAVTAAVESAVAPLKREIGLLKGQIAAAGNLTKALAQQVTKQLAKGGAQDIAPVLARLNEIEALIKGPRGDFRGIRPGDFEAIPHAGDGKSELNKGTVDRRRLADFLFEKQRAAGADAAQANRLHKAISKVEELTTSAGEVAQIAQTFGFTA